MALARSRAWRATQVSRISPISPGPSGASSTHRNGEGYILQVCDTGVGFPPDLDLEAASSLGLRLVQLLAKRLCGEISLDSCGGSALTIRFPIRTAG